MSNEGCSGSNVILSFALGALVGAALAALMSPYSGPEARRKLAEMKDNLADNADDLSAAARERVSEALSKGRDYMDEKKSIIESAVQAGKEAYLKEKERYSQDV